MSHSLGDCVSIWQNLRLIGCMEKEFLEIVTQYQAIIYKVCHLYADNAADVDDLFQEIVVNLWRAYPQFEQRAKVTTWMYRVALNTAITQLRRHRQRPTGHDQHAYPRKLYGVLQRRCRTGG